MREGKLYGRASCARDNFFKKSRAQPPRLPSHQSRPLGIESLVDSPRVIRRRGAQKTNSKLFDPARKLAEHHFPFSRSGRSNNVSRQPDILIIKYFY